MSRDAGEILRSGSTPKAPTHVLFDFFGTLVHYDPSHVSQQGHERSFGLLQSAGAHLDYEQFCLNWRAIFDEFNEAAEQSHREFSIIELVSTFLHRTMGEARETLVHDFIQAYISEWNQGVQYIDGLSEMLTRLQERFTLAVITNTHDPDLVPNHLTRMGVSSLFSCLVTSVEFGARKPAPDIFSHTLDRLASVGRTVSLCRRQLPCGLSGGHGCRPQCSANRPLAQNANHTCESSCIHSRSGALSQYPLRWVISHQLVPLTNDKEK